MPIGIFSPDDKCQVICLTCRNTFPAYKDKLDINRRAPQNYICPYCRRLSKVRVLRPSL